MVRWQCVYVVVSESVHDVCKGEDVSYSDMMCYISVRHQENTPLPVVASSCCIGKFWCIFNSSGYHGNTWRAFLSAAFWEAGAWQGPKMTVIETPSNVSPTARGQRQGHSIFILILKTWTFLTTNKTSQTCQVENYANIKLFLSQNTVSTEGCLGVGVPVVRFIRGLYFCCWRNWRHELRNS